MRWSHCFSSTPHYINAAAKAMRRYPVNSDKQQAIGRKLNEAGARGRWIAIFDFDHAIAVVFHTKTLPPQPEYSVATRWGYTLKQVAWTQPATRRLDYIVIYLLHEYLCAHGDPTMLQDDNGDVRESLDADALAAAIDAELVRRVRLVLEGEPELRAA